ncbi:hypothetical protein, partial [Stutzerimonas stutzeri]|uniref:hypothetical protein n=1 Tax=Stutzerimonas stutzeri TaxID=316 RepID=UPI001C8C1A9C
LWIPGLGILLPENQGRLPRESAMNLISTSKKPGVRSAISKISLSRNEKSRMYPLPTSDSSGWWPIKMN